MSTDNASNLPNSNSRRLVYTFIALLGVLAILFFTAILPQVYKYNDQRNSEEANKALQIKAGYIAQLLKDRVSNLELLASNPTVLNAVMLSDTANYELAVLLQDYQLIGDPTTISIFDVAGHAIYKTPGTPISQDDLNSDWVKQLANDEIPYYFKLRDSFDRQLNYTLAIPIHYGKYIEGILFASVNSPADSFFQSNGNDFNLEASQGETTVSLFSSELENPVATRARLDAFDLNLTLLNTQKQTLAFENKLRDSALIGLCLMLLACLLLSFFFGQSNENDVTARSLKATRNHAGLDRAADYFLPAIILAFGLAASYVAYRVVSNLDNKQARAQLIASAKVQIQEFEDTVVHDLDILKATKSFIDTLGDISLAQFEAFVDPLIQGQQTIQAIEWVPRVAHSERLKTEQDVKKQGYDGYRIKEFKDGELVAALERDVYYPIYYVSNLDENREVLGLDLGAQSETHAVLHRAQTSGELSASHPISLSLSDKNQMGVAIAAPVYQESSLFGYKENTRGFVLISLNLGQIADGLNSRAENTLQMTITDISQAGVNTLVYASGGSDSGSNRQWEAAAPLISKSLNVGGRRWQISVSDPAGLSTGHSWTPVLVLTMGSVFSVLASLYTVQLARRRQRTEKVVRDRTKELQELSAAMENAVEGVAQLDTEGRFTYVNESYARTCGYSSEEMLQQSLDILIPEEQAEAMSDAHTRMMDHGGASIETVGLRKDGTTFHSAITLVKRFDKKGNFDGHYCFMSDISVRKTAEEALIRSNIELERFAYLASHDLQEPLRMVSSFAELLEDEYGDRLDEDGLEYLNYITDGSSRMKALVEDILNYAKLDQAGEKLSETDGNRELNIVLKSLHDSIEKKEAKVTCDILPTIYVTPIRFNRLLQNLIGNALKYCSADRKPEVHVGFKEKDYEWEFSVSDNGIGMQEEYLSKIFAIFTRLHHRREYEGTGIGLAICKKIVESMGGRIWAESEEGVGSTFYFTVPKNEPVADIAA